jgi:hypothetical protein
MQKKAGPDKYSVKESGGERQEERRDIVQHISAFF